MRTLAWCVVVWYFANLNCFCLVGQVGYCIQKFCDTNDQGKNSISNKTFNCFYYYGQFYTSIVYFLFLPTSFNIHFSSVTSVFLFYFPLCVILCCNISRWKERHYSFFIMSTICNLCYVILFSHQFSCFPPVFSSPPSAISPHTSILSPHLSVPSYYKQRQEWCCMSLESHSFQREKRTQLMFSSSEFLQHLSGR